jgi:hypothetical protein
VDMMSSSFSQGRGELPRVQVSAVIGYRLAPFSQAGPVPVSLLHRLQSSVRSRA